MQFLKCNIACNMSPTFFFFEVGGEMGVKLSPAHFFFLIDNCYLLTWNLAHILSNLKTIKKQLKHFKYDMAFFTEVISYQHFLQVSQLLLIFVKHFKNFSVISIRTFLAQYLLWEEYFTSFCFGGAFFLSTSNKFAIQNNPLVQLRLIFHKTLIKTN